MRRTAAERWYWYFDHQEDYRFSEHQDHYAMRGDGTLVIFDGKEDEHNAPYFLIKTEPGPNGTIYAELASGERSEIYCEPIWLCGWTDIFYDMFNTTEQEHN